MTEFLIQLNTLTNKLGSLSLNVILHTIYFVLNVNAKMFTFSGPGQRVITQGKIGKSPLLF